MDTPKPVLVNTGEQEPVYGQIDDFFKSIEAEIEAIRGKGPFFVRRIKGLYEPGAQDLSELSDDYIHMLLYDDRVLACVTELRTAFNRVHFTFFKNLEVLAEIP